MGLLKTILNPSLVANCTKHLIAISPKSAPSAEVFCNDYADTLYELKSEGWGVEGCVNLLCIYLMDIPALADKTITGAYGLVIACDYATAYADKYPTAGATRPLTEALNSYKQKTQI